MGVPGVGAMLGWLTDHSPDAEAVAAAIGRKIVSVTMDPEAQDGDGALSLALEGGDVLVLFDNGRSCCESRYMHTDDDLAHYSGAKFERVEVESAPDVPAEYDEHERQFLRVYTSKGVLVVETHNEHNGYYGGFDVRARLDEASREMG